METVLLAAAALACPVGMGAMMWFMAKGMRKEKPSVQEQGEVTELRAEHARLGAEIERLQRGRNGEEARLHQHAP